MNHYAKARYRGEFTVRDRSSWEATFWTYVEKTDSCWLWTASTSDGYGVFAMKGAPDRYAHRISWQVASGLPAGDLRVCHHCDVRACVRPTHLFLGTPADNQADMAAKERSTWGTKSHLAQLSEDDVREIRRLYRDGMKQHELARRFSTSRPNISLITTRRTWAYLPD